MPVRAATLLNLILFGGACAVTCAAEQPSRTVVFNRDIRPLLADKCFRCHGPDVSARQAELRLDRREEATAQRDGYRVLAPGRPAQSELVRRITSEDDDDRMPPGEAGVPLSDREIELIRRWIAEGAEYQVHWSFIPPRRPPLPGVRRAQWARNPIDLFVLHRVQQEGLAPSTEATRTALIRRVTLDLTGLPPTPAEVDAFLADNSPTAYEELVDRLLQSPRFGERMALPWLDAARFADTNGYFTDKERSMWRWRGWLIAALNHNMPFDQFTIEQLAGDLLPGATDEQKIATGFNRNHMVNNETGIVEEEFRVEYVVDRVQTTSAVWLGLTIGCARCHDHKYDPVTQEEFYRLFAFFNNVPERGLAGSRGNAAPLLPTPTKQQLETLDQLHSQVAEAARRWKSLEPAFNKIQAAWEKTALDGLPAPPAGDVARWEFEHATADSGPSGLHGRAVGAVAFVPGMIGAAARLDGDAYIRADADLNFERTESFSWGAWIHPTAGGTACVVSKIDDANDLRGFDLTLRKGKAVVHLIHRWSSNAIQVVTRDSVPTNRWQHLMVTYDGSSRAAGVKIYLDGKRQTVDVKADSLTGSIITDQPLRIGRRRASASFQGLMDDVRIYDRELSDVEVDHLATGQLVRSIVTTPAADRSADQRGRLRAHFLAHHAPPSYRSGHERLRQLNEREARLRASLPTTMIMQELDKPRTAFVLLRGQYDQRGKAVSAGVPARLPPLPREAPGNRLALARWLVDPSHPLTARVTVNRLWQHCWGSGIVETVDDFGTQGAWPSHPALLDWLATEFVRGGWDVKRVLRLIVTSAAYRQSSHGSAELSARDPHNRLLARGPRFRMPAEMVRDNALAVSGLLHERLGGPSVKPHQPAGLWRDVSYDGELTYVSDGGGSLYRRSLYTYIKRQSPPPNMLAFDAPTRETCIVRRSRTNTPIQALVLMNDPVFVEAARKLAERMLAEGGRDSAARAALGFRLATARQPEPYEVDVLLESFQKQLDVYRRNRQSALRLLEVGESEWNPRLDACELAAWTTVASMILSLDEVITRE